MGHLRGNGSSCFCQSAGPTQSVNVYSRLFVISQHVYSHTAMRSLLYLWKVNIQLSSVAITRNLVHWIYSIRSNVSVVLIRFCGGKIGFKNILFSWKKILITFPIGQHLKAWTVNSHVSRTFDLENNIIWFSFQRLHAPAEWRVPVPRYAIRFTYTMYTHSYCLQPTKHVGLRESIGGDQSHLCETQFKELRALGNSLATVLSYLTSWRELEAIFFCH